MSHYLRTIFLILMPTPLSEIEWCVRCKNATPFRRDDPIETRTDYIEGCGQLCHSCAEKVNAQHRHTKPIAV